MTLLSMHLRGFSLLQMKELLNLEEKLTKERAHPAELRDGPDAALQAETDTLCGYTYY